MYSITRPAYVFVSLSILGMLLGCQATKATQAPAETSVPAVIADSRAKVTDEQSEKQDGTLIAVQVAEGSLKDDSSSQDISGVLSDIVVIASSADRVPDRDRLKIEEIQQGLASRLREKVKGDVLALHEKALKANTFKEGYVFVREAGEILALYPLDNLTNTVKEAEELSFRQNEVLRRLERLQRQRYNHWAAGQAEKSLEALRTSGEGGKISRIMKALMKKDNAGCYAALEELQEIDPSFLEPSVMKLYEYVLSEIMDKFKANEKATVAKVLTDKSSIRRGLGDF